MASSRLELGVNDAVRLTTTKGEAVAGSVHALDDQTNTLVLRMAPADGAAALPPGSGHLLRFFCVNAIASIELDPTVASGANGEDKASQAQQQDIGEDRLAKLEREARAKSQRELAKINPSVTPKGQMAFDHISKIYSDCRWSGQSIVIMDQVRIDPPYARADIKTLDASVKADFIDRLGNMMEKVAKKLDKK